MDKSHSISCIKCEGSSDIQTTLYEAEVTGVYMTEHKGRTVTERVIETETRRRLIKSHDFGLCKACYEAWKKEYMKRFIRFSNYLILAGILIGIIGLAFFLHSECGFLFAIATFVFVIWGITNRQLSPPEIQEALERIGARIIRDNRRKTELDIKIFSHWPAYDECEIVPCSFSCNRWGN